MPLIQFPNVPKLPGVPQVRRSSVFPAALPPVVGLALGVARLLQLFLFGTGWGIYKSQKTTDVADDTGLESVITTAKRVPVLTPDTFLEFSYRNESAVADYPIQQGSFVSYDKVANPFEIVLRVAKGGNTAERQKFLDKLESLAGDLELYDIVTPERSYLNVNIVRYEVARRREAGAYWLSEVDIYFREIRFVTPEYLTTTAPAADTSDAKQPSARPAANNGTVQATQPPANVDVTPR